MTLELFRRGLGAQLRSGLVWAIALVLLTVSVLATWPELSASGSLDQLLSGLSPEMIAALGLADFGSPAGYLNGNLYALLLPLLFGVLGIMHMNGLTAGDEDAGRLELLLALPVRRTTVYLARFAAVGVVLVAVGALVGATVVFGAPAFDMDLDAGGVIAATTGIMLLGLFHAALVLALAGLGLRSAPVLGVSFGVLILGYLVHALLPMIDARGDLVWLSPWHWALGGQPLVDGFDARGCTLLASGTAVLVVVGLLAVRRRTIRTA